MLLPILTGGGKLRNFEKIDGSWDSTVYLSCVKKKLKKIKTRTETNGFSKAGIW